MTYDEKHSIANDQVREIYGPDHFAAYSYSACFRDMHGDGPQTITVDVRRCRSGDLSRHVRWETYALT